MRYFQLVVLMACATPSVGWAQPSMELQAGQFTRVYLDTWSSNGHASLRDVGRIYAPRVRFYGRVLTHSGLEAEKRRFLERWPSRRYALRPGTVRVACDGRVCTVNAILDWSAQSASRRAATRGTSRFVQAVDFSPGRPVIIAETGFVLRQARQT